MGKFLTHMHESAINARMAAARKISNPIDKAIAMYTIDPVYKYMVDDVITSAIKRYPNKQSVTIYRGLNFSTKQQYTDFIGSITDGKLTTTVSTSWSPSQSQAKVFAKTKPSFMEFMSANNWADISAQSKSKERIVGYRGVVLSTTIPANSALDMTTTEYAVENEIIVPPGEYSVSISELKTFKDTVADDSDINTTIKNLAQQEDATEFLQYILHHHGSELNDASKRIVFKLLGIQPFDYTIELTPGYEILKRPPSLAVHMVRIDTLDTMKPYILKTDYDRIITQSRGKFKQLLKDIQTMYKPGLTIDWGYAPAGKIAELLGLRLEYTTTMQKTVGAEYARLNSREHTRQVTDIDQEAERIVNLLRSMG